MADETSPETPKKHYQKRKGEFNDLTIEDMLKKVKELTDKISQLKISNNEYPDPAKSAELKETIHTRVRAYRRLKALGHVMRTPKPEVPPTNPT